MPMPEPLPTCWAIHDGAAGNRRQVLALAAALPVAVQEWSLAASAPARWLAPRRLPGDAGAFGQAFAEALRHPPPRLAIGCGRLAGLATRQARAAGASALQILDPRIDPRHWDLVIAPEHDRLRGDNVLTLVGSLNPVDAAWLQAARGQAPTLGQLPGPRTTVLLGGPTAATGFDTADLKAMLATLEGWLAHDGGRLLICGSRRTPRAWAELLRERYRASAHLLWLDASDGDNPFAGALGWADRIVVTPDSVNMISEACATAVPVFVAGPERARGRIRRFIASLQERGRVRAPGREPESFAVTPLQETARVAALVRARLSLG
jgi:mitochondrial fission protein ELM1